MKQGAHGDGRVRMRAARGVARETGPCAARDPARNRRGEARAKQGAREGVVQMCAKRVKGPEMRTRVATGAGG